LDPLVSVVILNYQNSGETLGCLSSLGKQSYPRFEVIVVDNGSDPVHVERLEAYATQSPLDVRVIRCATNKGVAGGRNEGLRHARGEYVAFLDSDTVVDEDWLRELIHPFLGHDSHGIGATTSTVRNFFQPELVEYGGLSRISIFGQPKASNTIQTTAETRAVAGASFMVPRSAIGSLGEFNCPAYFFWWEEIDLSWRLYSRGYKLEYVPTSVVFHRVTSRKTRAGAETLPLATRNKYLTFYRNLSHAKFLLISPLLLGYDLAVGLGYVLVRRDPRFLGAKVRGVAQFVRTAGKVQHVGGGALSYLAKRLYLDKLG
jgi:GT2 family glycosyltransferase